MTNSRAVHQSTTESRNALEENCPSCILNILHFLLSLPFPLPGVSELSGSSWCFQCPSPSFRLQLIYNPKSPGKCCTGQASPKEPCKQNNPCSRRVTPSRFGELWLHESENAKTLFACSPIPLNTFGKDQVRAT